MSRSSTVTLERRCTCPRCGHRFVDDVALMISQVDQDRNKIQAGRDAIEDPSEDGSDDRDAYLSGWEMAHRFLAERQRWEVPTKRFFRDVKKILEEMAGFKLHFANEREGDLRDSILHPTDRARTILRLEAWRGQGRLGFRLPEDEVRQVAGGLKVRKMKSGTKWVFVWLPTAEAARQLTPLIRKAVFCP